MLMKHYALVRDTATVQETDGLSNVRVEGAFDIRSVAKELLQRLVRPYHAAVSDALSAVDDREAQIDKLKRALVACEKQSRGDEGLIEEIVIEAVDGEIEYGLIQARTLMKQ